jgi:Na+-translocating ferredoxin:NAD+ oxidoreductase RnfA subunit
MAASPKKSLALDTNVLLDLAAEKMRSWQCQPFLLSSTQLTIALKFAYRLIDASLLPDAEQMTAKSSRNLRWLGFLYLSLVISTCWILMRTSYRSPLTTRIYFL